MRWATLWEGRWIFAPLLILTVVPMLVWRRAAGLPGAAMLAFTAWFFRDPERPIPEDPAAILSPADGVVTAVEKVTQTPHGGPGWRLSIFLSVFDVHVNRFPTACTVLRRDFQPGQFLDARKPESAALNQMMTWILRDEHGRLLTVRQITGAIARRIVAWAGEGDSAPRGARMGMIRFGSRTDLFLPFDAEPCIRPGQRVTGGASVVARWVSLKQNPHAA